MGKGTVKIIYSANGEKLQRAFIPESGAPASITTYINGFTYQETATITTATPAPLGGAASLSYINFEEGRIRVIMPTAQDNGLDKLIVDGNMDLPGGKRGAYDYFVMDYQQNVRLILTEEVHIAGNTATMETSRATLEESIFGQTGGGNEVAATRLTPKPVGWTGNPSNSVSSVGISGGHNIGPNTLQKVMAGDMVTAAVQYYYQTAATGNDPNFLNNIISNLFNNLSGGNAVAAGVKNNAAPITSQLNVLQPFKDAVQPAGANPGGSTPKAYLTIIFFDERFNFIAATDGGVAQQQVTSPVGAAGLALGLNIKAPKNGYAYVYVSNQSNQQVYFDNLNVIITAGNIIEENHYYAYGLKIAGISSKKFGDAYEGTLKNDYLYNDKELFDDGDLNWYDYGFRNYDAQIGRFTQLDPLTDEYPELTPYQYASNDPIDNIDIDGLEGGLATVGGQVGVVTAKSFMKGIVITAVRQAPKVASKTFSTALKLGTKALLIGLQSVPDNTSVNNTLRNPNIPILKKKTGGIPFTSKIGQGGDDASHATNPDSPVGIDWLLELFGWREKAQPHPLRPDFKDPLAYPELLNKALESYEGVKETSKTSAVPKKFEKKDEVKISSPNQNPIQARTNLAPVYQKKGNVIYNRGGGFKTRVTDGKGGGVIVADDIKATDTFPAKKVPPDYIYPLK